MLFRQFRGYLFRKQKKWLITGRQWMTKAFSHSTKLEGWRLKELVSIWKTFALVEYFVYRLHCTVFFLVDLLLTSVSKKSGQTIIQYHYCGLSRFFWNRCHGSNESTRKEAGKAHLCALHNWMVFWIESVAGRTKFQRWHYFQNSIWTNFYLWYPYLHWHQNIHLSIVNKQWPKKHCDYAPAYNELE